MKKQYTVKELEAMTSLKEVEGRLQTGSTKAVQYKEVQLADSETFQFAVVVSYSGGSLSVITRPELRGQFLNRGC
jgi:hypothetical protein